MSDPGPLLLLLLLGRAEVGGCILGDGTHGDLLRSENSCHRVDRPPPATDAEARP